MLPIENVDKDNHLEEIVRDVEEEHFGREYIYDSLKTY